MAGIIHTTVPVNVSRRLLLTGAIGVFAGVATTRVTIAQDGSATPASQEIPAGGPERLHSLLSMIPANPEVVEPQDGVLFYYADLKRQLDSLGIPPYEPGSEGTSARFNGAIRPLAAASVAYQYGNLPEFAATFGFSALQAEETLSIGNPPNDLTIFRGGLPIDELPAIWEASGYFRETGESGVDIWTAGKEGELDLTTDISQYGVGSLNNVAIFGDTVVFGRFYADVDAVALQVSNPESSVADQEDVSQLLATLAEETVSAIAVTGSFLDLNSIMLPEAIEEMSSLVAESDDEIGTFPQPRSAIFAITAGALSADFVPTGEGTPAATPAGEPEQSEGGVIQVRLVLDSEEDAAVAVAAVEYRWNTWNSMRTGAPYTELMEIVTAEPDLVVSNVATIDCLEVRSAGVWIDIVLGRDLAAFAWSGEAPVEATPTAAG
jgi:hypothetical protein